MSGEKQKVWFGGLPTDIDVQKIVDAIGKPEAGRVVTYEQLETITGLQRAESRFGSVVGAWRRRIRREHNLECRGVRNEGILVCSPSQRIDLCEDHLSKHIRGMRRVYKTSALTPRDDLPIEKARRLDHVINVSGALLTHGKQIVEAAKKSEGKLPEGKD